MSYYPANVINQALQQLQAEININHSDIKKIIDGINNMISLIKQEIQNIKILISKVSDPSQKQELQQQLNEAVRAIEGFTMNVKNPDNINALQNIQRELSDILGSLQQINASSSQGGPGSRPGFGPGSSSFTPPNRNTGFDAVLNQFRSRPTTPTPESSLFQQGPIQGPPLQQRFNPNPISKSGQSISGREFAPRFENVAEGGKLRRKKGKTMKKRDKKSKKGGYIARFSKLTKRNTKSNTKSKNRS